MSDVNEDFRTVNDRFKRMNIRVDHEWLNGCVQFFREECPTATSEQLWEQADEQWQLSDLGDSGSPCLPDSIFTNKQSHTITGTYPLQLQYLIDIAVSAYDQLQQLHNKQLDEGMEQQEFKQNTQAPAQQRNNAKNKRVLKLELSDGRRCVTAMEYTAIPCLTTKLSPGMKILLTGPMRCVNHVLFLEAKNVKLIGGEVEPLMIPNAFENVLLRQLNRPLNPNPKTNYDEPTVIDNNIIDRPVLPRVPMTQTAQPNDGFSAILDDDFDDALLLAIDSDQLSMAPPPPPPPSRQPQRPPQIHHDVPHENSNDNSPFNDSDDALLQIDDEALGGRGLIENPVASVTTTESNRTAATVTTTAKPTVQNINVPHSVPDSIDTPQRNNSICDDTYSFKIRGINFVFVKQLLACPIADKLRRRLFIVKAHVVKVIENTQFKRGKWSMGVTLLDSTDDGEMPVRLHNDLLVKLTGLTVAEANEMRAIRKERPQVNEDFNQALSILQQRLEHLNAYMKIEFIGESEYPIVLEIIEPARVLEEKLQEKIKKEIK